MVETIQVGMGADERRIAVLSRPGSGPPLVWFGGFRSDMRATKAEALDRWAAQHGRSFLRFDYSGHGESGGAFEDGTITRWLDEGLAVIGGTLHEKPILVGSSMGAWLATLAAMRLTGDLSPAGLVLIAPAIDFTERLMWDVFPQDAREALDRDGVYHRRSAYAAEPYPITRTLIEDGRRHLLLNAPIPTSCPIHILQGMADEDVPWEHALTFVERLPGASVQLTLVKDGDHRLSRPEDLDRLLRAVEAISSRAAPNWPS